MQIERLPRGTLLSFAYKLKGYGELFYDMAKNSFFEENEGYNTAISRSLHLRRCSCVCFGFSKIKRPQQILSKTCFFSIIGVGTIFKLHNLAAVSTKSFRLRQPQTLVV